MSEPKIEVVNGIETHVGRCQCDECLSADQRAAQEAERTPPADWTKCWWCKKFVPHEMVCNNEQTISMCATCAAYIASKFGKLAERTPDAGQPTTHFKLFVAQLREQADITNREMQMWGIEYHDPERHSYAMERHRTLREVIELAETALPSSPKAGDEK